MPAPAKRPSEPVVLLAGNDESVAGLRRTLKPGFSLLTARSGAQCVATATRRSPDVVVVGSDLEGMDRLEVVRTLSSGPTTTDLSIIVVGEADSVEERLSCLESGASDYLVAPLDARELRVRIEAAARMHRRVSDLRQRLFEDPITGLLGQRALQLRLAEETARSRRTGAPLALMLTDIDRMTDINERHGREAGDRLLQHVARTVSSSLRVSDTVYRHSGDSFASLLPDIDVSSAGLVAERVRELIRAIQVDAPGISVSIDEPPPEASVTASFGVADLGHGRDGDELIERAQAALDRARRSGGDRIWRGDDPRRHSTDTLSLAQDLTEREWDVLTHLAQRRTEQDIAARLGISSGTVRSHKARIRRKLNIPPNTRLSDFARDHYAELLGHSQGHDS